MGNIEYSRGNVGEVLVDTWQIKREDEDRDGVSPIALITGIGAKPSPQRGIEQCITEYEKPLGICPDEFRDRISRLSYFGSFPYDLALKTGQPVHVLWQTPESSGELVPKYTSRSLASMVEALDTLSIESGRELLLASHSYGAFAHAKILEREHMGNFLPGVMIAPMTNTKDVVSNLGIFSKPVMEFYKLISQVSFPLFNITSLDYFHGSRYDKAKSKHQAQNHLINSASARLLLKLNLEDVEINPNNIPTLVITTQDRLISYEVQKNLARKLEANNHEISAGHRIFTDRDAADRLLEVILELDREQIEKYGGK
ncbi:MAG: alpha/beta hydrolase [Nanoarchaeota archaeon]|nr:alpha/beta hydrolase [Nanoarchaeota archaeon]